MDIVHDLQGGACPTIEDTAKSTFRDACELRENFLCHVLIFHQLLNSIFHIRSHRDEKGQKATYTLVFAKLNQKIDICKCKGENFNFKTIFNKSNNTDFRI